MRFSEQEMELIRRAIDGTVGNVECTCNDAGKCLHCVASKAQDLIISHWKEEYTPSEVADAMAAANGARFVQIATAGSGSDIVLFALDANGIVWGLYPGTYHGSWQPETQTRLGDNDGK